MMQAVSVARRAPPPPSAAAPGCRSPSASASSQDSSGTRRARRLARAARSLSRSAQRRRLGAAGSSCSASAAVETIAAAAPAVLERYGGGRGGVGGVGRHGDGAGRHDGEVGDQPFRPVLRDQQHAVARARRPARAGRAPAAAPAVRDRAARTTAGRCRRACATGTGARLDSARSARTGRPGWGRDRRPTFHLPAIVPASAQQHRMAGRARRHAPFHWSRTDNRIDWIGQSRCLYVQGANRSVSGMIEPAIRAAPAAAAASSASCRSGTSADLYAAPDATGGRARPAPRPRRRRSRSRASSRAGSPSSTATRWPRLIERYEPIEEQLGRVGSYAQLLHAAQTDDPEIGRFFQTMQERVNADLHAAPVRHARDQPDRGRGARRQARAVAARCARYRPWLRDVRSFRPHQLDDEIERVLHEKSVTGRSAWVRLFDETMAGLRFPLDGKELTSAEIFDLLSDKDRGAARGRRALDRGRARRNTRAVRADHQHARQGQGDRGRLAPLRRGRSRRATSPTRSRTRWSTR